MGFDYDRKAHSARLHRALRSFHLRITPQREIIFDTLCRSRSHPTADHLYEQVKKKIPHITLDTVNRTLLLFARINLAAVVEGSGHPRRYDADLNGHHHFHCLRCGVILDFEAAQLCRVKLPPEIERNNKILYKRLVLTGLCADCHKRELSIKS